MLKTLLAGQEAGTQNTSPRKLKCGSSSAAELENSSDRGSSPAATSASGSAGMTPPLAEIAATFSAPPPAISQRYGNDALARANAPSRAYDARCAAACRPLVPPGATDTIRICVAIATSTTQPARNR